VAVVVLGLALIVVVVVIASGSSTPLEEGPNDQRALGAQVFAGSCATCHGPDLRGTFVGPPLLDPIYAPDHHDDGAIRAAIANGVEPHHWDFAAMPPIPVLVDEQVDAVIAHIRAVQVDHGIGAPPAEPAEP
jgi:mono/diheme cytochrome c family protein